VNARNAIALGTLLGATLTWASPGIDAGAADAGRPDAGRREADAGRSWPTLAGLQIQAEYALLDGGWLPLSAAGDGGVPLRARFRLTADLRLEDARARLLDPSARAVPADAKILATTQTVAEVTPMEPLKPGSVYRLVLEADSEPLLQDVHGKAYAPPEAVFTTEGEAPKPTRRHHR
jgi:hypothetical protein